MCPEDRLPPQGWCAPPAPWGRGGPRREGRRALFLRLLGTLPRCVTLTLRTSAPRNPAVGAVLLRVPLCPQPRPGTGAGTGDGRGNRCLGVRELPGQRGGTGPHRGGAPATADPTESLPGRSQRSFPESGAGVGRDSTETKHLQVRELEGGPGAVTRAEHGLTRRPPWLQCGGCAGGRPGSRKELGPRIRPSSGTTAPVCPAFPPRCCWRLVIPGDVPNRPAGPRVDALWPRGRMGTDIWCFGRHRPTLLVAQSTGPRVSAVGPGDHSADAGPGTRVLSPGPSSSRDGGRGFHSPAAVKSKPRPLSSLPFSLFHVLETRSSLFLKTLPPRGLIYREED